MNEKKLQDITQELRDLYPNLEKESEEKVLKVFQNLKEIQKKSFPQALFKKNLKEKLDTLHTLGDQSTISELQSHRFSLSLLSGLFASFIFVAGFLYVIQGILFQNPVTNQNFELYTLTGEQLESTDIVDTFSGNPPDNILKVEDVIFNGVSNPYKTTTPSKDTISEKDAKTPNQNILDNSSSSTKTASDIPELSTFETQDISPQSDDTNASSSMMMRSSFSDQPDSSSQENTVEPEQGVLFMELMNPEASSKSQNDTFQEYCNGQGGRFNANARSCSKGQNTCNEGQYNSGNCNLDTPQKEDIKIDAPAEKSTQGGL